VHSFLFIIIVRGCSPFRMGALLLTLRFRQSKASRGRPMSRFTPLIHMAYTLTKCHLLKFIETLLCFIDQLLKFIDKFSGFITQFLNFIDIHLLKHKKDSHTNLCESFYFILSPSRNGNQSHVMPIYYYFL